MVSPSNFQSTFSYALRRYKKRAKEDLLLHPLAARLQSCDSTPATLSVLQEQASNDERLMKWLSPAVNVLSALSSSLGDAGLILSPAKVIFVGIGVLLSATRAIGSNRDKLIDVFTRIGHLFQRLETYAGTSAINSTKDMNGKVILAVLPVLAILTEEIKQGPAKKYFKKLVGRSDVEDALQTLEKWLLLVEEQSRLAAAGVPNISDGVIGGTKGPHNGHESQNAIPRLANGVGNTNHSPTATTTVADGCLSLLRHQPLQVRRWLSPPDPSTNHNMAHQARLEGTAQWFLEGNIYSEWKTAGSLLWIHGKPGSGKSVLCSAIIEDIKAMRRSEPVSMAYFFFDYRDHQKQSRLDMITSLLTQLSTQSNRYCDILSRLYSVHNHGAQMPTSGILAQCLKDILSLPRKSPVYIIMDAIDECPNIPGVPSPREEILELVKELLETRLPNLRLCVTSRPEVDIRAVLEPLPSSRLSLHDETGQKQDIVDYIRSVVYLDHRIQRWREEDKELVVNTLSGRANGMFRWVSCQLDTLRHCFPPNVRRILDELPESLDETYERILMEINNTNGKHARRLLQCLAAAIRPLRVEELAEVLEVGFDSEGTIPKYDLDWRWEDQEQAVLSACSSLVGVVNINGTRVVQFSHPSVKEFLMSHRLATSSERISFYHILLEPAHTILAKACLIALFRLNDRVDEDSIEGCPLAEYAARHWIDHALFENVASHIQDGMALLFDPEMPHFTNWVKIYDLDDSLGSPSINATRTRPLTAPLYYSSLCGLHAVVKHLIVDRNMDVNARGGHYATPLHASLYMGHIAIALLLIEHGAEVNARDDEDSTPLRMALHCGYFEVVQALLGQEVDVNTKDDKDWTPLHIASHNGHLNAVQLLLEKRAEVDVEDVERRTPLHMASVDGDSSIVQVLLEHGAKVTTQDNTGSTSLHLASAKGNLEVVELLIQRGAFVDSKDEKQLTPLHLALTNGNRKIVEFLIGCGADVNAQDNKLSTPLHQASLSGDFDLVSLLVKHHADVNAQDNKHWSPLHSASDNGAFEVVELLLQSGAKVDARDNKRSTPLHVASRRGFSNVVTLLLRHGTEPNVRNDMGWTPLHIASHQGAVDVVRCLLGRGADVNAKDGDRRTPLHIAVNNKNPKIVQLLIENGADPYAQDKRKKIPFQMQRTAGRGRRAVPRL